MVRETQVFRERASQYNKEFLQREQILTIGDYHRNIYTVSFNLEKKYLYWNTMF